MPWKVAAPAKPAPPPRKSKNVIDDVVQSARTGILQGAAGLASTMSQARPGANLLDTAVGMADNIEGIYRAATGQKQIPRKPFAAKNIPGLETALTGSVGANDMNRMTQRMAGDYYKPETTPGRYAQSIGQMAPAMTAPGSLPARVANTVIPGVTAQASADLAKTMGAGEKVQELARFAGGAAGGLLANVRVPNAADLPPQPPRVLTPEQRNIQTLKEAGVSMTPGQRMGGQAKNMEDLASRAPVLGAAIKGARNRGVESLNRAVGHRALEPLGEGVPENVHTGHDTVRYVADRLGQAYDDAASMVPQAALDAPFMEAKANIQRQLLEQPETVSTQFNNIIDNRLGYLRGGTPATGQQIRDAQSQIGKLAADFSSSDDGAQRALGNALDDLATELGNVIGRASPEAADLIGRANAGWSIYTRMRNAAAKAKGGVFTPGQLNTAVRTMDKSVGKGNVAKGEAVLQDLSNAAWEALPDSYGNPGTADAVAAGTLLLGALNPKTAPFAIPTAAGLGAASVPYALMGRRNSAGLPPPIQQNKQPSELETILRQMQGARVQLPEFLSAQSATQPTRAQR